MVAGLRFAPTRVGEKEWDDGGEQTTATRVPLSSLHPRDRWKISPQDEICSLIGHENSLFRCIGNFL